MRNSSPGKDCRHRRETRKLHFEDGAGDDYTLAAVMSTILRCFGPGTFISPKASRSSGRFPRPSRANGRFGSGYKG